MNRSISRRGFVGAFAAAGLTLGIGANRASASSGSRRAGLLALRQDDASGPFTLPPLPYEFDALEPHIDALTMEIHHDRHHQSFVTNLNNLAADHEELQDATVEELVTGLDDIPEEIRTAVRNNAGGHLNHSMFWELMTPGGSPPTGDLAEAIERDLGGLDALMTAVNDAGLARFGSGWAWVVANEGELSVVSTPNQDNPLMDGAGSPILGVDVWEHAYYLNYQNRRADYLTAWWNTVNWDKVAELYTASM